MLWYHLVPDTTTTDRHSRSKLPIEITLGATLFSQLDTNILLSIPCIDSKQFEPLRDSLQLIMD